MRTSVFDGTGSVNQITDPFEQLKALIIDNFSIADLAFIIQYFSPADLFARNMGGVCSKHQRGLERDREGARHQGRSAGGEAGGHSCDGRGEDATLAISGQRSKEQVQKMDFWHSAERSTGPFIRKFTMPENAVLDRVTAKEANGVLTVIVPKLVARGSQPRRIELGTSGGAENRPGSSTSGACDRTH